MINYFRLNYSTDISIGTTFPQSQDFESVLNIHDPKFIWNNEVPLRNDVYIPNFILHNKAKFTDLISSSSIRYALISQKLYDCIVKFNHNSINFYQTKLLVKSVEKQVFMICGKTKGFEFLDLRKTEIDLLERFKFCKRLNLGKVEDIEEAVKTLQYPNTIAIKKYYLSGIGNEDVFYIENIHPGGSAYIFSNRLKEAIVKEKYTGIEFEPIEVNQTLR